MSRSNRSCGPAFWARARGPPVRPVKVTGVLAVCVVHWQKPLEAAVQRGGIKPESYQQREYQTKHTAPGFILRMKRTFSVCWYYSGLIPPGLIPPGLFGPSLLSCRGGRWHAHVHTARVHAPGGLLSRITGNYSLPVITRGNYR